MVKNKNVIILEGADACGKSQLSKHIQDLANGKCHIIHSNYNKNISAENHRRQHKLIMKFVNKQFNSKKYYTGNNVVILDRCYISDITYGQIGYGSKGDIMSKLRYFNKLLGMLSPNIKITLVYCKPKKSAFNNDAKDELLNNTENNKMQDIYDNTLYRADMLRILRDHNVDFVLYDFIEDPEYKLLDAKLVTKGI